MWKIPLCEVIFRKKIVNNSFSIIVETNQIPSICNIGSFSGTISNISNGKKIDSILKNIWTGFELSESKSGSTPPIIPNAKTTSAWFTSKSPAEYKGVIVIPVAIIAIFMCCSNDAMIFPW